MNKSERIEALCWLGKNLLAHPGLDSAVRKSGLENPFFTEEFCWLSLRSVLSWLQMETLNDWLIEIPEINPNPPAEVGLIMAGNIPLVGWHDMMTIFASGNRCRYKVSSQDAVLPLFLVDAMIREFPSSAAYFEKSDQMKGIEVLIASGSSASSRQFDYYFRNIPRIIRGSKSSLGIIYGFESIEELSLLADDIMQYFGMGCRSVTKILVPEGYDFEPFFQALEKYRHLTHHHRYQNNAIYHKAIFLMNGDPFLENDMLVVREQANLFSPPGVLNYQNYQTMAEAQEIVQSHASDMQCLVSHAGQFPGSIPFGTAQKPSITDYADGVNTLGFLQKALG